MAIKPTTYIEIDPQNPTIGDLSIKELAKNYKTPLYIMDAKTVEESCGSYLEPLKEHYPNHQLIYASKANINKGILQFISRQGIGIDVVSGGELYTALQAGISPNDIYFHGNNKSIEELTLAIKHNIKIVIDNKQELQHLTQLSETVSNINVLLRVNPQIEAHTHAFIQTGQSDSKFGINQAHIIPMATQVHANPKLTFLGLHAHIGSQIFDVTPYEKLVDVMISYCSTLKTDHSITIQELNLGGGIGIRYTDEDTPIHISNFIKKLSQKLIATCKAVNLALPKLILEPGRSLVGNAGITVYTIGTIKELPSKTYLFIDGGMADNIRPMLYDATYSFGLIQQTPTTKTKTYTIAGKFCESSDILGKEITLPVATPGDYLIVFSTGAYNYSMASNYNRARRPEMLLVDRKKIQTLVKRETWDHIITLDNNIE